VDHCSGTFQLASKARISGCAPSFFVRRCLGLAFLSARNDAVANVAIIAAGLVTAALWASAWPDLIVGLGIAVTNADAAREVWFVAREEHKTTEA
jgi:Co/Zn/Cd efflux system component